MEEILLTQLQPGERGKVLAITAQGSLRRRILDMGILRGVEVMVERVAPLGDPIQILVRGYRLSLRKDEAVHIQIEEVL